MTYHQESIYDRDLYIDGTCALLERHCSICVISCSSLRIRKFRLLKVAKNLEQLRIVGITKYNLKIRASTLSDIRLFVPVEEKEIRLGSIILRAVCINDYRFTVLRNCEERF